MATHDVGVECVGRYSTPGSKLTSEDLVARSPHELLLEHIQVVNLLHLVPKPAAMKQRMLQISSPAVLSCLLVWRVVDMGTHWRSSSEVAVESHEVETGQLVEECLHEEH